MFNLLNREKLSNYFINVLNHQRKLCTPVLKSEDNQNSCDSKADLAICNKSGLLIHHRNILQNKLPYKEPSSWIHVTEKYQRKIFGRYGFESGISPNICFHTKSYKISKTREELEESETLHLMIDKYNAIQKCKIEKIYKREEEIDKKLEKLSQWKQELNSKILKKEADAIAAKEKKDRLIEEVRRHFGYKIDPKDERFKEVLEQKEREDKKKQREAKRIEKDKKLMSRLVNDSVKA